MAPENIHALKKSWSFFIPPIPEGNHGYIRRVSPSLSAVVYVTDVGAGARCAEHRSWAVGGVVFSTSQMRRFKDLHGGTQRVPCRAAVGLGLSHPTLCPQCSHSYLLHSIPSQKNKTWIYLIFSLLMDHWLFVDLLLLNNHREWQGVFLKGFCTLNGSVKIYMHLNFDLC